MKPLLHQLQLRFSNALSAAFGPDFADSDPLLAAASDAKFGDYQCNVALSLAKPLGQKPRQIAEQIVAKLDVSDLCELPEIAGPGFINLRLTRRYLEAQLMLSQTDPRLGVAAVEQPQRVVLDFSSPNIAKEMHVGHLRSTIIGESLARVLEFLGHDTLRLNHVGDWGTQFGMLIAQLQDVYPEALTTAAALNLGDLVTLYRAAKQRFDTDAAFKERSRQMVVALQSGDPAARHAWLLLCDQSRREFQAIYDLLEVRLQERGESFYEPYLAEVVKELDQLGLLVENQGAKCVFLEGFTNKEGEPLPVIIQKSDGGYNYATTDLAAIRYRVRQDQGQRLLYVVASEQDLHLQQIFTLARKAGWLPEGVIALHVPFGLVLGEDGKKLRTRSGGTVRLQDLLDEAISRARADLEARLQERDTSESEDFKAQVSQRVGLSAVKYADLSQNRTSNYAFSFDKMLSLKGNTAPYMLYAYARVQSIGREGGIEFVGPEFAALRGRTPVNLEQPTELALAKHLLSFGEVVYQVADDLLPNRLCQYLFELSQKYNQFYENCPVLKASEPTRSSRLMLCDTVARTLKLGLSLLGISVLERM